MSRQSRLNAPCRKVPLQFFTNLQAAPFLLFTGIHHEKEYTMKTKSLIPAVAALTLSVSACSSVAPKPLSLLGDPAPAAVADRTITVTPDTKYVNVEGGQIV